MGHGLLRGVDQKWMPDGALWGFCPYWGGGVPHWPLGSLGRLQPPLWVSPICKIAPFVYQSPLPGFMLKPLQGSLMCKIAPFVYQSSLPVFGENQKWALKEKWSYFTHQEDHRGGM